MATKTKQAAAEADEADADIEADGEAESSAPKGKFSFKLTRKLIVIAAGAIVALAGGSTGAYLFFADHKDAKANAAPVKATTFFDVPEVLVNLSNPGNDRTQYLKVKIVLELPDPALTPQVQTAMPRVMDAFQTYLRELRPTDLDGSAGLYRLKEELTRRVNAALSPGRINAVLFKEIVVQ
jgi:flagellar protein FliL